MHKLVETRRIDKMVKVYWFSLFSLVLLTGAAKVAPSALYSQKEQNIFNGLEDRATYRCGKLSRILDPKAISCKINKEDFRNSVLLVGNSHADSIKMTFANVAGSHKFNTYFLVSNTPLMDNSVTPEMLVAEARKLKTDQIVLHFSPKAISKDVIERVVLLAEKSKIDVKFILPVPIYNESVPKILYENNLEAQYDVNKYLDNNHEIIADLESIKHKYKNFSTYEVHQVLCHPNCVISDAENHPYYFDDDHLNLTGANQLASVFEKIFKERNNVN